MNNDIKNALVIKPYTHQEEKNKENNAFKNFKKYVICILIMKRLNAISSKKQKRRKT